MLVAQIYPREYGAAARASVPLQSLTLARQWHHTFEEGGGWFSRPLSRAVFVLFRLVLFLVPFAAGTLLMVPRHRLVQCLVQTLYLCSALSHGHLPIL